MTRFVKFLSIVLSLSLINSCDEDSEDGLENVNLNSFTMVLGGEAWVPSFVDDCEQLFTCSMSELNSERFYEIKAYRDPDLKASFESENYLDIQIMNVSEVGTYPINESYGDFTSYARFRFNEEGQTTVYENKLDENSFYVDITEFLPREYSALIGIKGSFRGSLYNMDEPNDSIEIQSGEFVFQRINRFNFNQCAE